MPRTIKQGKRSSSAVEKKQASAPAASRPGLYLETLEGERGPGMGYVLSNRFREQWEPLRRSIEGDIQRIRAHSTANYDEQTKKMLAVRAQDAESPLKQADVLAELLEFLLVSIEDALGNAQDDVEQGRGEDGERQEPKRLQAYRLKSHQAHSPTPATADFSRSEPSPQPPLCRPRSGLILTPSYPFFTV